MIIKQLKLKNFRQHTNFSYEFPAGIIAILGNNGVGKTSLLEAIAYALFGSLAIRGKLADLKTKGSEEEKEFFVELVFEHEDKIYRVIRTLDNAQIYKAGEPEAFAAGLSAVTEQVTRLFNMDYQEFFNTYFTGQKSLEFLSSIKGGTEREKFVLNMLGLSKVDQALQILREDKKQKRLELSAYSDIAQKIEELNKEFVQEEIKFKKLKNDLESEVNKLKSQELDLEKLNIEFKKSQQQFEDWSAIEKEISKFKILLNEYQEKLVKLDSATKENLDSIEIEKLENQIKLDQNALEQNRQDFAAFTVQNQSNKLKLVSEKSKLETESLAAKKRLNELATLKDKANCPTCEQALSTNFNSVLGSAKELCQQLLDKEQELKQEFEQFERLQLDNSRNQMENQKVLEKKIKLAQEKLASLKSKELKFNAEKEQINNLNKNIVELTQILEPKLVAQQQVGFDQEQYKSLQTKLVITEKLMQTSKYKKVQLEAEHNSQKSLIARISKEQLKNQEQSAVYKKIISDLEQLEQGDQLLSKFRSYLNSSLRPRLAELASEFIADLTDGRFYNIEVGKDFSAVIWEDGEPKPVISGGEEDILHLSMRLALSQLMGERAGSHISMLALDEIFGSLDELRRQNVINLLERLKLRYEQIIIITHCEDIKECVEHSLIIDYDQASLEVSLIADDYDQAVGL